MTTQEPPEGESAVEQEAADDDMIDMDAPAPPHIGRGRPRGITPEQQEQLYADIKLGLTTKEACMRADVNYGTYMHWQHEGRKAADIAALYKKVPKKLAHYHEFHKKLRRANADRKQALLGIIIRASMAEPMHARWLLERTDPQHFAPTSRTEVTGKNGGPVAVSQEARIIVLLPDNGRDDTSAEKVDTLIPVDANGEVVPGG